MRFPQRAIEQLRAFVAQADPDLVTTRRANEILESFCELEKLAGAGKLLFAARAAESNIWAAEGHRSPAAWLADKQKSSLGDAISAMETSERIGRLERTEEALREGKLSVAQAREVALAGVKDPDSEKELLEAAQTDSLKTLKERTRQLMARSSSKEEENQRYKGIQRTRFFRKWTDYDGAIRLEAKLTPDTGARVVSAIEAEADGIFADMRQQGTRESPMAYRADALVRLVTRGTHNPEANTSRRNGERASRTDTVVIRVDAAALRRGYVRGGEVAEIPGVGPVPVETVRRFLPDSFVKLLVKDGVDVLSVCHVGRLVSAHVQSALEERDPICVVPGCDVASGLENHHWVEDFAKCRTTSLASLARVCARHHDKISYEGFKLIGGPGKWELVPPPTPPPRTSDTS